jgi:hypothetical protein
MPVKATAEGSCRGVGRKRGTNPPPPVPPRAGPHAGRRTRGTVRRSRHGGVTERALGCRRRSAGSGRASRGRRRSGDARAVRRNQIARRKGQHVREQLAVRPAEREGVGGAIGEPGQGHATRVEALAGERRCQCPLDEADIGAERAGHGVPRPAPAVRREQDASGRVRGRRQQARRASAAATRAVEHEDQRAPRVDSRRHVEHPVTLARQSEDVQAGRHRSAGTGGRRHAESLGRTAGTPADERRREEAARQHAELPQQVPSAQHARGHAHRMVLGHARRPRRIASGGRSRGSWR